MFSSNMKEQKMYPNLHFSLGMYILNSRTYNWKKMAILECGKGNAKYIQSPSLRSVLQLYEKSKIITMLRSYKYSTTTKL